MRRINYARGFVDSRVFWILTANQAFQLISSSAGRILRPNALQRGGRNRYWANVSKIEIQEGIVCITASNFSESPNMAAAVPSCHRFTERIRSSVPGAKRRSIPNP